MEDFIADKLSHASLRDFAARADSGERASVIVELEAPPASVEPRPATFLPRLPSWEEVVTQRRRPGAEAEPRRAMDTLGRSLNALPLDEPPVRLDTAQAYVVNVSPEQLRSITRMPGVGLVRPNRVHRVPPR